MSLFYLFVLITCTFSNAFTLDPLSDEFIDHINSKQNLWTAGRNFHRDIPLSYFRRLTGSLKDNGAYYLPKIRFKEGRKIRETFDARSYWRYCPTLKEIRDQGSCGSCWAVSAVSAMSDRVCIKSKGKTNFHFAVEDVLSCCTNCGAGCDGGVLSKAWLFTKREGTVSGGNYESDQGCKPYEIPPCEHDTYYGAMSPQCNPRRTPRCKRTCQPHFLKKYNKDKKKIKLVYAIDNSTAMQMDILTNGPITSSFKVYEDLLHYKTGVYRHTSGGYVGDHSVKILGWGKEKNVKYWLAANSWNTDWGSNGFFKIVRDENHCGIETAAVAGYA